MDWRKIIFLLAWNVIVFGVYGIDKWKAIKGKWRIPEATLLILAAALGGIGAFSAMKVFRHKTQHKQFTIGVPLCLVLNAVILYFIFKIA